MKHSSTQVITCVCMLNYLNLILWFVWLTFSSFNYFFYFLVYYWADNSFLYFPFPLWHLEAILSTVAFMFLTYILNYKFFCQSLKVIIIFILLPNTTSPAFITHPGSSVFIISSVVSCVFWLTYKNVIWFFSGNRLYVVFFPTLTLHCFFA